MSERHSDGAENAIYAHGVNDDGGCLRCGLREDNAVSHECPPAFAPPPQTVTPDRDALIAGAHALDYCAEYVDQDEDAAAQKRAWANVLRRATRSTTDAG